MIKNKKLSAEFKNKKILVTGGTGSVGTGIVKQLIKYKTLKSCNLKLKT